jgi:thymidylate synthase ThyX
MSIHAKIIADSISESGKRITSFELEYPRFIHAEFLTHRMVSKNGASSRAIPISTTIKQIFAEPAMPVFWGKNQSGMSAKEELDNSNVRLRQWAKCEIEDDDGINANEYSSNQTDLEYAKTLWLAARDSAIYYAKQLSDLGLHKQISNRILEPWVNIKVVATATEWDNFFHLRRHPDAQPEIHALANAMWDARELSIPTNLEFQEWHLPYVSNEDKDKYSIEDCIKLSASLCAQVSYRKSDESIEKALMIYDRLVESKPVHASPFEHQASPSPVDTTASGNFFGWNQYRQTIKNNVCKKYEN